MCVLREVGAVWAVLVTGWRGELVAIINVS